jgi:superfamily II DNA/RNA helicase
LSGAITFFEGNKMGEYNYPNRSRNYGSGSNSSSGSGYTRSGFSANYSAIGHSEGSTNDGRPSGYKTYGRSNSSRSYGNNRFASRSGSGNFGSRSRFGGGNSGGRGRGGMHSEYIDENKYIKKAQAPAEQVAFTPKWTFADLQVDTLLKRNIALKGYVTPTPIQEQAISQIIEGKDFLGIANTGTGKTAAYLIPLIEQIIKNRNTKVMIIVPTRELAEQINDEIYLLTRDLRMFSVQCIGGASINNQIYNLRRGYNFVVGTPGRLNDLIERRMLNMNVFSTIVLDEVDRMLDMGFVDEIRALVAQLPETRQSLFFSATINPKVEKVMQMILKPGYVKVSVVTGETAKNVDQDVVRVSGRDDKITKLKELLRTEVCERVLVFVSTKREVDSLDQHLYENGFAVDSIHGDKKQRDRQRSITNFKSGKSKILIATDVAARGLDIPNVSHVINYDEPQTYQDYIHRIGRTGRADKSGIALTFVQTRTRFF